ncbi:hypothetical protein [Thalassotalea profundi]|uniref:Uncharacterized protein n=1 Tax=Thalassotalea profundi TaxID=2036687 RepID=A0ABQ3IQX3_9GAMM|nr:hypothetical protein [Thalassotalea profundi]GHE91858.1 hypothetical protein GCM10011501_21630 [Thalassotalea profundi]
MNLYRVGLCAMITSFLLVITAVYLLFISDIMMSFPWTMFWHFTILLTGLTFKLSYVMILVSKSKEEK